MIQVLDALARGHVPHLESMVLRPGDDAPAVVVTAECARNLNDFVDESNDTRRFVGAVAARSKVARAVDSTKCPPAATAARRAVVFGDEIAVQSIGGRRLDVGDSTSGQSDAVSTLASPPFCTTSIILFLKISFL